MADARAGGPRYHVVYLAERFPERSQTFVTREIQQVTARGIDVTLFAREAPFDAPDDVLTRPTALLSDHVPVPAAGRRRLLARQAARNPLGLARAVALYRQDPSVVQHRAFHEALVAASLVPRRPDRVHAHFARHAATAGMYLATMLGVPYSFTTHAYEIFKLEPLDLERKLERARPAIAVCDYNRRWVEDRWPGVADHVVVPCGVDSGDFRRQRPYRHDPFTVVSVGRLVPKKGFDVLVSAVAELVRRGVAVRCEIHGDGPLRAELDRQVAAAGLEGTVVLAGATDRMGVRRALEDASVFALPCRVAADGDRDSQPVVIKEAMAMELPVVATDEVGCPEMVADGATGRLVPPEDPMALADALLDVHRDPDRSRAMGVAGRDRVRAHFDFAVTIPALLDAWGVDGS